MPKMTIRVILKSGSEFAIKCDKFTIKQNGFGQATGYNIEGITENKPVYLDFEQVAAVVRLFSDEHTEDTPKTEKKRGFTEKRQNAHIAAEKLKTRLYTPTKKTKNTSCTARSAGLKRRKHTPARRRR